MYLSSRMNWTELADGPHQKGAMDVHSAVCLQRFQDAEQSVAFLSFDAELESRARLVLLTSLFFAKSQSSEMQGGLQLSLGESAGTATNESNCL